MGLVRGFRTVHTSLTTIPSGGTTTPAIDVRGHAMGGFATPAALTGTSFTFTTAFTEGGTYRTLKDASGTAIPVTVAASGSYVFPPEVFAFGFVKIVSNSAEGADRVLEVGLST